MNPGSRRNVLVAGISIAVHLIVALVSDLVFGFEAYVPLSVSAVIFYLVYLSQNKKRQRG